jgi:2-isopropylmalate synthase
VHGVGMDPNIVMASLKATLGAVLRLMRQEGRAL